MKENIKETIVTIGIIIGGVVGTGLAIYVFIGFLNWLFSDPFNWIDTPNSSSYVEPIDFQICRDSGGIPIKSGWTGELKRCEPIK